MQIKKLTFICLLGLCILNPAYSESPFQPPAVKYQGVEDGISHKNDRVNKKRGDYKCFVDTNVGEGIYDFSWYVADTKKYILALPGERLNNPNLPKGVLIYASKVHECVPESDNFSIDRARELDESRLL